MALHLYLQESWPLAAVAAVDGTAVLLEIIIILVLRVAVVVVELVRLLLHIGLLDLEEELQDKETTADLDGEIIVLLVLVVEVLVLLEHRYLAALLAVLVVLVFNLQLMEH